VRVSALRVSIVAASVCVPCDEIVDRFSELRGEANAFILPPLDLAAVWLPTIHHDRPTVLGAVKDTPSAALKKRRP
jgi:hypothetical protein